MVSVRNEYGLCYHRVPNHSSVDDSVFEGMK